MRLKYLAFLIGIVTYAQNCPNNFLDTLANYDGNALARKGEQHNSNLAVQRAQAELLKAQAEAIRSKSRSDTQRASTAAAAQAQVDTAMRDRLLAAFKASVTIAKNAHADFDTVANRQDVALTQAMQQAVIESDIGGELIYYFGKHPEEAVRLSKLTAISSVREIGRIEAKLQTQAQ